MRHIRDYSERVKLKVEKFNQDTSGPLCKIPNDTTQIGLPHEEHGLGG